MRVTFSNDDGSQFERWANEYGSVFKVTTGLGRSSVMLCDPKAVVHFYSKDDFIYSRLPFSKTIFQNLVSKIATAMSVSNVILQLGGNMLSAEFEDHRRWYDPLFCVPKNSFDLSRMRRAVAPAFSTAALRSVLGVFYDEAYKVFPAKIVPLRLR